MLNNKISLIRPIGCCILPPKYGPLSTEWQNSKDKFKFQLPIIVPPMKVDNLSFVPGKSIAFTRGHGRMVQLQTKVSKRCDIERIGEKEMLLLLDVIE